MKLHDGEKKIEVFRKHRFYLALDALLFALLAVLPYTLVHIASAYFDMQIPATFEPFLAFAYSLWMLFIWIGFFIALTNYILDIWILTSERLIDVEQHGLFSHSVSTLQIDKIQDVTVTVAGIVEQVIGSGKVSVQTAGENREFHIPHSSNPERIKERILTVAHVKHNEIKTVRIEN